MRMNSWAGLAAVTMVGVMATTAFAQPPGGGRGGRGPGGFGGGFGPMSAMQLAANEAVQKDLGVTEDQTAKLKTLSEEASTEMREAFGGGPGGGGGNLSDEERAARAAKRTTVNDKYKAKLAEVLNTNQMERLGQITLQASGPQIYSDPAVLKALNLTKDQQDKLASINKDYGEKARELMPARGAGGGGAGGGDIQERFTKLRELNQARDKDLLAVLTADQQTQLTALKGKEFDVAQLRGGPGGAGGRRPGARPQN